MRLCNFRCAFPPGDLGDRLIAKKAEKKHGEFIPWIEANCVFSYDSAKDYMKVAKAKRERAPDFNACTSIREVLALGKSDTRVTSQPKVEPDAEDLKTIDKLNALAERGATEGERESAQAKLDAYTSAFNEPQEEIVEKAKTYSEEPEEKVVAKFETLLSMQSNEWLCKKLLKAMLSNKRFFNEILKELNDNV